MLSYNASGFRNFTEKATHECYTPNAEKGNLGLISFDFGANLLKFLQQNYEATYVRIINSDKENVKKYGVGNAMAMPYNHTILPLSKTKEGIELQIKWGIIDFESRFGRKPKGMWLPECAVNYDVLAALAKNGLEFTILGENQVKESKKSGIYCTETHEGMLILFLFDNDISNKISFYEDSTKNADDFTNAISKSNENLLILASDGEVYGHHHKFQDIFLQHLLSHSAKMNGFEIVFPEMLLNSADYYEVVDIIENTSWSCPHNLDKWKNGCSCTIGDSSWKKGLRESADILDTEITLLLESESVPENSKVLERFIITKIIPSISQVFADEFLRDKSNGQKEVILKFLDAKYYSQLAMTSCGYFFDDLDDLRPINNIRYAVKAVSLVNSACGAKIAGDLEKKIFENLQNSKSWKTGKTALMIYEEIKKNHDSNK